MNAMTRPLSWLEDRLNGDGPVVIIDGGMATELEKAGVPMDRKVWSGRAVLSHPETVQKVHETFITSGAEVVIANTFASARHMLESGGLGDQVKEINVKAVTLAQQAIAHVALKPVALAGSICEWPPGDDSRWNTPEAIYRSAREQAQILAEAGVDLIALEMCQQADFSMAVVEAARETGLPVWIGMSARRHGGGQFLSVFDDPDVEFEGLVKRLADYPVMLMNIMHTPASDVPEATKILAKHWQGPIGIYPESGHFVMPNWHFVDVISPEELTQVAPRWVQGRVRLLGGCCGLGPEHISALRQSLQ